MKQMTLCKKIESKNEQTTFNERQKRILRFVDEQLETYTNDPGTVKGLLEYLSPAELVETVLIIGLYVMIARLVAAVGTDPDGEVPRLDDMIRAGVS